MNLYVLTQDAPPSDMLDTLKTAGWYVTTIDELTKLPRPDALLIHHPDALAYCRQAKQIYQAAPLPILVVADDDPATRQALLQAGATNLLASPPEAEELLKTLLGFSIPFDVDIVGHDLKSPMGTVVSSLSLLQVMVDDPTISKVVEDALSAANRQTELIDFMVDYYRLKNASYDLDLQPLPLDAFLQTLHEWLAPRFARKNVAYTWRVAPDLPSICADEILLRRVLIAIVDTSLKFCTSQNTLTFSVGVADDHVYFDIVDDGRGILIEHLPHLFEPDAQFEARLAGSRTTVAFNLPFAHSAIVRMGGTLTARMNEDALMVFQIQFPVCP